MSAIAKPKVRVNTAGEVTGATIGGEFIRRKTGAAYMRTSPGGMGGANSPFFFNWNPALREERDDVRSGYIAAASRAIDALHNSGWIAGAVTQSVASIMGDELRLAARPDQKALGWTAQEADDWSDTVERRFSAWSNSPIECDAAGKQTTAQQCEGVLRSYYGYGEALFLLPSIRRTVSQTRTKVQMLPPSRLAQDSNIKNRQFQGVSVDAYGLPLSYKIKNDPDGFKFSEIRARDGAARPQVGHIFEGAGMRGITPLAPVLQTVKQYDQLADATLQAALIQAIFAATVTGDAPTSEMLQALQSENEQAITDGEGPGSPLEEYLGAQEGWYNGTRIDLGGSARVVHMFPGQKLELKRSEHPNSTYEAFAKFLLREIASCLGMTFEGVTGDYSGASYSSVRMATSEKWPIIKKRRNNICGKFMQMVYETWLEEQIEEGFIPFPGGIFGFWASRPAAVIANWRGPAKPQADDLKTAKAHQIYQQIGIMSDERIADDLGFDIGDEYERRAREKQERERLGLPEVANSAPIKPLTDEEEADGFQTENA